MKLQLDVWYELWDRAGSQGLDTWHEVTECPDEATDRPGGSGPPSETTGSGDHRV
jgi:hypothetical protein